MDVAVSQVNKGLIRPVTIAAALIGTFEALLWTCLSLVSILYYNSVILIDDNISATNYRRTIYEFFLDAEAEEVNDKIIVTPGIFNLFMYFYLVLSFVWLVTSLYMFWAMIRNKWSDGFIAVGGWAGITIIISLLDVVIMSLVVADFLTVQDMFSSDQDVEVTETASPNTVITLEPINAPQSSITTIPPTSSPSTAEPITDSAYKYIIGDIDTFDVAGLELIKEAVYIAYGIVISLAVRGYVLWIVNIIFACVLMKFAYDLKKVEAPSLLPIMDAYAGGRAWNNLYEQTDISNGYSNDAFKDDNDRSMFPRSDSFINRDSESKNRNPLSNGANPYETPEPVAPISPNPNVVNGRVAKIGKRGGRRTPPQNVPPPSVPSNSPYIPDPDYSPPPSPRPKSVLRPKSNYVL